LTGAAQEPHAAACMAMAGPALIAGAAGDSGVDDDQVSRLEACDPLPDIGHDCAALMPYGIGERHDLVADSSLRIIMNVGSARPT
jgi:hypothetical protein